MNGTALQQRCIKIADEAFEGRYSQYLDENQRVLWGLLIDQEGSRFEELFGEIPRQALDELNDKFAGADTAAGYRVDAPILLSDTFKKADVLLLSKQKVMPLPCAEIDSLILHELVHWYIDSGISDSVPLLIEDADSRVGAILYGKLNPGTEHFTGHSMEFCRTLCCVARRAAHYLGLNPADVVSWAMQFEQQVSE